MHKMVLLIRWDWIRQQMCGYLRCLSNDCLIGSSCWQNKLASPYLRLFMRASACTLYMHAYTNVHAHCTSLTRTKPTSFIRNPTITEWNFNKHEAIRMRSEISNRNRFWLKNSLLTCGISSCLWKFQELLVGFIINTTSKSLSKFTSMHKIF